MSCDLPSGNMEGKISLNVEYPLILWQIVTLLMWKTLNFMLIYFVGVYRVGILFFCPKADLPWLWALCDFNSVLCSTVQYGWGQICPSHERSALTTEHGRSALIEVVATHNSVAPNLTIMHNNEMVVTTAADPCSNSHDNISVSIWCSSFATAYRATDATHSAFCSFFVRSFQQVFLPPCFVFISIILDPDGNFTLIQSRTSYHPFVTSVCAFNFDMTSGLESTQVGFFLFVILDAQMGGVGLTLIH